MLESTKNDRFAAYTGIEIIEVAPGYAKTRLVVREHHLNAVDIVHGGALFTLADYTAAVAGNAGEQNQVAIEAGISFLKPGRGGILFAEAREVARSRSLASYEVHIINESGDLLATFRVRSFVRN